MGGERQGHTLSGQSDIFHRLGEVPVKDFLSAAALSSPCCSLVGAQAVGRWGQLQGRDETRCVESAT